jgi:transposase
VAQGYEIKRVCEVQDTQGPWQWHERVLVIRSLAHAEKQAGGLEHRLASAETEIRALTPARGRGKRQISDESQLLETIGKVLKTHRVEGLMTIDYVKQTE